MSKVAVIVTNLFEDVEYVAPVEALKKAGHEIVNIGLEAGETVKGVKEGTEVLIDRAVEDVSSDDFDALLIPGGYSPDRLRASEEPVRFTREFVESGKPVFAICHAPQLLITAQVMKDRRMAGYRSIIQDIKNAGAEYVDEEVVEDGNIISSRDPRDIPAFNRAILARLGGPFRAR